MRSARHRGVCTSWLDGCGTDEVDDRLHRVSSARSTQGTGHKGTFKLVSNILDTGTVSTTVDNFRAGNRDGQPYELIQTTDTYTGKRGTLVIRTRDGIGVAAGYGHSVITGTWVVVGGTGIYEGASGRGRAATVLRPRGTAITSVSRLQGILTTD